MRKARELIKIVSLIAKLRVQLSQIAIDDDLTVQAHIHNELPH